MVWSRYSKVLKWFDVDVLSFQIERCCIYFGLFDMKTTWATFWSIGQIIFSNLLVTLPAHLLSNSMFSLSHWQNQTQFETIFFRFYVGCENVFRWKENMIKVTRATLCIERIKSQISQQKCFKFLTENYWSKVWN